MLAGTVMYESHPEFFEQTDLAFERFKVFIEDASTCSRHFLDQQLHKLRNSSLFINKISSLVDQGLDEKSAVELCISNQDFIAKVFRDIPPVIPGIKQHAVGEWAPMDAVYKCQDFIIPVLENVIAENNDCNPNSFCFTFTYPIEMSVIFQFAFLALDARELVQLVQYHGGFYRYKGFDFSIASCDVSYNSVRIVCFDNQEHWRYSNEAAYKVKNPHSV